MLVGLLGYKFSGKDTVADHIVDKYKFEKYAFATALKDVCQTLFSFSQEQLYGNMKEQVDPHWNITPRSAFQFIGTGMIRDNMHKLLPGVGYDFWVRVLDRQINSKLNVDNVVISDCRFGNEVDYIKSKGGIVIKIIRTDNTNGDDHVSEAGIDNVTNYDYTIYNDGTIEELYKKIDKIIDRV
jgi:hypothetical protein